MWSKRYVVNVLKNMMPCKKDCTKLPSTFYNYCDCMGRDVRAYVFKIYSETFEIIMDADAHPDEHMNQVKK